MLKKLLIIFTNTIFLCVFAYAQEKPQEQKEEIRQDSFLETTQPDDSSYAIKSTELKIWNKVCPVMGNKVEADGPTVEYNGKLYGFCCPGCDAKFKKNPQKYSKNLNEDGTRFIGRK